MVIELLLIFLALAVAWSYSRKRVQNFPPGPIGLPLVGHLPLMGIHAYKTLCQWEKTYGPIIGVNFGTYRVVVINGTKLIREALKMNEFSGRPRLNYFKARCEGGSVKGIIAADGEHWTEQRRFVLRTLRDLGFGRAAAEAKVQEEINEFLERLKEKADKPIQVKGLFNVPILNTIWSLMFGERVKHNDPEAQEAVDCIAEVADNAGIMSGLSIFLPWIANIAPKLSGFEDMMESYRGVKRFLRKQIESHRVDYIENQPRDLVDAYMDEAKNAVDPQSSFHEGHAMLDVVFDLFAGTTETASTVLAWMMAYLLHHTEVQEKLQSEIDRVVGKERQPSLADRPSLPFTEAVINEVMRFSTILPFSIYHAATEDVNFHGFFIPKGTMIVPNFYSAHFDEAVWGDPQNFRPERFLDENGKFVKNENLMPFSIGKRVCPAESLGRDELFMFTASIFQTFSVQAPGKLPNLEPNVGFTLSPKPFEIVLKKRFE